MKNGNLLLCLALSLYFWTSQFAFAELVAEVDRDRISMGDTMRLSITATDGEDVDGINLRPLLENFDILQRSTSSNTKIINGIADRTKQLNLDLTPKRKGTLSVPALRNGNRSTNLILVSVSAAAKSPTGNETFVFEAEVDKREAYVHGQVIATFRVQNAIPLGDMSISNLSIEDAFYDLLEQRKFQRIINNRTWEVHEVRYAIFPEKSGLLKIPAITLSARESLPRRNMFDLGRNGRLLRRTSDSISIKVLPRPPAFSADTWLPARKLSIEENWSAPPNQIKAGESVTRTITLRGDGLQGAQLPPISLPIINGLKFYPDQPKINDTENQHGRVGERIENIALVPTREGNWKIPEISVPWWDTERKVLQYAVLPAREINVTGSIISTETGTSTSSTSLISLNENTASAFNATKENYAWKIIATISAIGWLLTLIMLYITRNRGIRAPIKSSNDENESKCYKILVKACNSNDASAARKSFLSWAVARDNTTSINSISDAKKYFNDLELDHALSDLEEKNYGDQTSPWIGTELSSAVKRLRKDAKVSNEESVNLALYQ